MKRAVVKMSALTDGESTIDLVVTLENAKGKELAVDIESNEERTSDTDSERLLAFIRDAMSYVMTEVGGNKLRSLIWKEGE